MSWPSIERIPKCTPSLFLLLLFALWAGCEDPSTSGGDGAPEPSAADAATADAWPSGDARPSDAAAGGDASSDDAGAPSLLGAPCTSDSMCGTFRCGPANRCGEWQWELVAPNHSALDLDVSMTAAGELSVAYDRFSGGIWVATQEAASSWDLQDTMLPGYLIAYDADPQRIVGCDLSSNSVFLAAPTNAGTWDSVEVSGAPECFGDGRIAGAFDDDGLFLAWRDSDQVPVSVQLLELDAQGAETTTIETLPAGTTALSHPRLAVSPQGRIAVAYSAALTTSPGSTSKIQTLRVGRRDQGVWNLSSPLAPVQPSVGCIAHDAGQTTVGLFTLYGESLAVGNQGTWTASYSSDQRGGGMLCGARADGLLAATALDPTTLELWWLRNGDLQQLEADIGRFGCVLRTRQELATVPGDDVHWFAPTAVTSAHDGTGCRITHLQFVDE